MTVAEYVVRQLAERGVTRVFTLAGGMICPLLDAMKRNGARAPEIVPVFHEQAAGFAAEGWARMTGRPGVAMATSGPGATNLLTAIASCYFDSTPAVFVTGQVRRDELKGSRGTRQLGFQETDICAMARPVTKAAWQVTRSDRIARTLDDAFALAVGGRPGPVLVDIPFDVQMMEVGDPQPVEPDFLTPGGGWPLPADERIEDALAALRNAERPMVLVGGGARSAPTLRSFLGWLGVPVVTSLLGFDALAYDNPFRVGFIGTYGNRWANWALMQSDVLLVLGSRLDIRQTGSDTASFAKRTIIHVDVDHAEIDNRMKTTIPIHATVAGFCAAARRRAPACDQLVVRPTWGREIAAKSREWDDLREQNIAPPLIHPNKFLYELGRRSPFAAAFVVDVGQHQMWAAQSLALGEGQRFLTSGGHGAMGFALPAAIGAALATGEPVVCVAGDGGFQVNLPALQTVSELRLPIKIVVLNNRSHGMVRQFQDEVFEGRHVATIGRSPGFGAIATAYGISAYWIRRRDEVPEALDWLALRPDLPALLEVEIPASANAVPKTRFGHPLDDMEPKR